MVPDGAGDVPVVGGGEELGTRLRGSAGQVPYRERPAGEGGLPGSRAVRRGGGGPPRGL